MRLSITLVGREIDHCKLDQDPPFKRYCYAMKNPPLRLTAGLATAVIAVFFAAISPLYGITVTVSADEDNTSAVGGVSLREAIQETAASGTVDFDISLNGATIFLVNGDITINKNLTIDASNLTNGLIVVQGNDQFAISGANTVNIEGLSFTGASSTASGGAFIISGGAIVTFTDCRLSNHTTTVNGGAIYNSSSTLVMNNCELSCNEAQGGRGGAIYSADGGAVTTLNQTVLRGNSANNVGGAIHSGGNSTITLTECMFLDNESGFGGAISQNVGSLTIEQSCFAYNKANTAGGALYLFGSFTSAVKNTCLVGNRAAGGGGAIVLDDEASMNIESSTVVRNKTGGNGGGIFVNMNCTLNTSNSVFAENEADGSTDLHKNSGTINRSEVNFVSSNLGVETEFPDGAPNGNGDLVGTESSPLDPELSPLGYYGGSTMSVHPLAGSPLLQAGGSTSLVNDQRGYARVTNTLLDLGAVEGGPVLVVSTSDDENDGGLGIGAGNSLRECINAVSTPGTRIVFSAGVNGSTIQLTNGLISTQDLEIVIDASAMSNGITIDGDNNSRIFTASQVSVDTTLALISLELTQANAGAVACSGGAKFTAADSIFGSNTNLTGSGGALSFTSGSSAVIDSCVFDQNTCSLIGGGAIYANYADLLILESTFSGNTASITGEARGGAIYSLVAPFYLEGCLFSNNTATGTSGSYGGAVYYSNVLSYIPQKTSLVSSTFTGNSAAAGSGGAIAIRETIGELVCRHLTVVSNNADAGAGLYVEKKGTALDKLSFDHCIIGANVAPLFSDIQYVDGGGSALIDTSAPNLVGDNTTAESLFPAGPLVGTMISKVDPLMGTLGHYGGATQTIYLAAGSPAIDAGNESDDTPEHDQRGYERVVGSAPDLGAYENGHRTGYTLWSLETIPVGEDDAFSGNAEDDTNANGVEYATGLSPTAVESGSVLSAELIPDGGGGFKMKLTFAYEPDVTDIKYVIERNDSDLMSFTSRYSLDMDTGLEVIPGGADVTATVDSEAKTITVIDGDLSSDKYFWELKIEQLP
ncbi:hypothetical protein Rhal01_00778 [Rubritalea halochordaticola]|uniref:Right-handed parallel beta-helix repeat-containing protein n=2 Tax=Rubritalea halochordaticola TaxID=714537 RepID=A0ABP9UY16_9BACT